MSSENKPDFKSNCVSFTMFTTFESVPRFITVFAWNNPKKLKRQHTENGMDIEIGWHLINRLTAAVARLECSSVIWSHQATKNDLQQFFFQLNLRHCVSTFNSKAQLLRLLPMLVLFISNRRPSPAKNIVLLQRCARAR